MSFISKVIAKTVSIYHGSDNYFDDYDLSKSKKRNWGSGMYFSTNLNEDSALDYGSIIYESSVSLNDLLDISNYNQVKKIADELGVELPTRRDWKTKQYDFYSALIGILYENGWSSTKIENLNSMYIKKRYKGIHIPFRNWVVIFEPKSLKIKKSMGVF